MNREKFAWLVAVAMIAVLALQIPGSLATRDDDYAFVRTLVDIHRQVANNYVDPVDESTLRESAIDGMLSDLDPFTVYIPPTRQEQFDQMLENSFRGVGIQLDQRPDGAIEVVTPIDGSPAFKAGVQAGDLILKVDGDSLEGLRLPDVVKKISGKLGTSVTLTVKHATGQEQDLTMTRQDIVIPTIKGYQREQNGSWDYYCCDDPKIAYVRITQFTSETYDGLKAALDPLIKQGMKGLILDLRFNPGGRLDQAIKVVDLFVKKGVIVSTKGRNRPETVERAEEVHQREDVPLLPPFPMIVLVNEHSASAAEIVSGSLMDNKRALVIGQRTYGKGSVQELIPLDNKEGELKLTVAYYYLPSGRLVHRKKGATDWGVQPQIVVPMDQDQERVAMQQRYEQEIFKRPIAKTTTQGAALPATNAATEPTPATEQSSTTAPATTQVIDAQLQRAIDTMVALVVLRNDQQAMENGATVKKTPMPSKATTTPVPQPTSKNSKS
jgi:carboxyl-terminal processing protease